MGMPGSLEKKISLGARLSDKFDIFQSINRYQEMSRSMILPVKCGISCL